MGFNITEIASYTEAATTMLGKTVLFSEDWSNYKRMPILGESKTIKIKDTFQKLVDGKCAIALSGGSSFTEKTVTSFIFGSNAEYCTDDLFGYGFENFDMKKEVLQPAVDDLALQLDELFWMGTSSDLYTGLVEKISGDTAVVNANFTSALDINNIDDAIQAIWTATAPQIRKKGLTIHCSYNTLELMRVNLAGNITYLSTQANIDQGAVSNKIVVPSYGGKIVLQAEPVFVEDNMIATNDDNIFIIEPSGFNSAKAWIYQDPKFDSVFNVMSKYGLGWDYGLGSEITILKAL